MPDALICVKYSRVHPLVLVGAVRAEHCAPTLFTNSEQDIIMYKENKKILFITYIQGLIKCYSIPTFPGSNSLPVTGAKKNVLLQKAGNSLPSGTYWRKVYLFIDSNNPI